MEDQKSSEGAIRAAEAIKEYENVALAGTVEFGPAAVEIWAAIIDRYTRNQWILCSKRMPTKEDGDKWGNIFWGNDWEHHSIQLAPWYNPEAQIIYSHWMSPPQKPLPTLPE